VHGVITRKTVRGINIVFVVIIIIAVVVASGHIQSSYHGLSFPNEIPQHGQNYFLATIKNRVTTSTAELGYNVMTGTEYIVSL
jgi:hypothetical protein